MTVLLNINPLWILVFLAVAGALITIGKWIGAVNSKQGDFEKFMISVGDNIKVIQEDIKKLLSWQTSKTITAESPLKLTALGKKISESIDAAGLADSLASHLRAEAEGKQAYDIQELVFSFVRDEYHPSEQIESKIKQCAYDCGLARDEVLDVIALELRVGFESHAARANLRTRSMTEAA